MLFIWQVSVASNGGARLDQALYMGVYTRLEREYNGRPAYKKMDGHEPLYVYYFTSIRDGISLWVIGPQLGQFIAGIRNSLPGDCVHDLRRGWTYASREGLWEEDDRSLQVRCHSKSEKTTEASVDCQWSQWSRWSECSKTCDGGETVRERSINVEQKGAGRRCFGDDRQARRCNTRRCPVPTTTTTQTTSSTPSVNCQWSSWSRWSDCSKTCDGGETIRERRITVKQQGNGRRCRGDDRQSSRCNTRRCPTPTTTVTSTTTITRYRDVKGNGKV